MKKNEIIEGIITDVNFPNKGVLLVPGEEETVIVKDVIPGQRVKARLSKKRHGHWNAALVEVTEEASGEIKAQCPRFGECGGCTYLTIPYEQECELKQRQVRKLLTGAMRTALCETSAESSAMPVGNDRKQQNNEEDELLKWFEPCRKSPLELEYRNKMEFSFGDAEKDGRLELGMHRRGSFYDIVSADHCLLVDRDYRSIVAATREFFDERKVPYFHRGRHEGYLRHLLVRKAAHTGEILIDLVTSGAMKERTRQEDAAGSLCEAPAVNCVVTKENQCTLLCEYTKLLLGLSLEGKIVGILHTVNDSVADIVRDDGTEILYGRDRFTENLLGLSFEVTPFSFFQTNSAGAEVLYETAREYIEKYCRSANGDRHGLIYDLYCGTGTITQLMAPYAEKVVGVEIVEEAVEAARENAARNGIGNCEFIAGDVLKVLDSLEEKPDLIILDPPRDGIHPRALPKILAYGVKQILYISCKPTSLARDLPAFLEAGYHPIAGTCVNQFCRTTGIETVCLLEM